MKFHGTWRFQCFHLTEIPRYMKYRRFDSTEIPRFTKFPMLSFSMKLYGTQIFQGV